MATTQSDDLPPHDLLLEFLIPTLNVGAQLADATNAGVRYQTRHNLSPSNVSTWSLGDISSSRQPPMVQHKPDGFIQLPTTPSFIPVHTDRDRGPNPAENKRTFDQFLTHRTPTDVSGSYCQVLGTLIFGYPGAPLHHQRHFKVELDLGSNDLWVYGIELQNTTPSRPSGSVEHPALFWYPPRGGTATLVSATAHTATYGDGSFATFKLWKDYIYLRPHWAPPPEQEPDKPWIHLIFGSAIEISRSYKFAPTSGILGLGRRIVSDQSNPSRPPNFLQQLRPHLESPEMTILLTDKHGYITFGKRPGLSGVHSGIWHKNIPVLGDEHWQISSTTKTLQGKEYTYSNGTAELDTGAAFCYVDDEFVKDYYALVPGSRKMEPELYPDSKEYWLIPRALSGAPSVTLDIGGYPFALEHSFLPGADSFAIGSTVYHFGALQCKSLIVGCSDGASHPDLIGRVALLSMEINLQFPARRAAHLLSWRRKDTAMTGPRGERW